MIITYDFRKPVNEDKLILLHTFAGTICFVAALDLQLPFLAIFSIC